MANHEMNTKCTHCNEEYDLRLRDTCPQCQSRKAYWARFCNILMGLGFQRTEYFDSDFADFDNIKVVDYRKDIAQECAIVYSEYHTADTPGEFMMKEQSTELLIGDSSVEIAFVDTAELIALMAKLQKMIKHG